MAGRKRNFGFWRHFRAARVVRFTPQCLLLLMAASIASASGPTTPIITTYAGTGTGSIDDPLGDGGPASQASLRLPTDLEIDASGNLFVVAGNRVRKITPNGIISTVAGNGSQTYVGDGVPATETGMGVHGIAVDRVGNLYISDGEANRIRKVSSGGIITTIAGEGPFPGFGGDGGPAVHARLWRPGALTIDRSGNLLVSDQRNRRIRKIDTAGIITTVVGNGSTESSGDGGAAVSASLATAGATVMDSVGNLYLIDGNRIRKVDSAGIITAYAGGGPFLYDPAAANIQLFTPVGLAVDGFDNLYVAESHHLVRMISPQRIARLVAGVYGYSGVNGMPGFGGDGGPADQARLDFPSGVAVDAQGNQFISDYGNSRIRKVTTQSPIAVPVRLDAFRPYKVLPLAGWPADIVAGDINGDRRSDIVTTTSADPLQADPVNDFKLRVHLQQADGTLAAPLSFDYPAGTANTGGHLALADFNQDGVLDVALGHKDGVSVLAGSRTSRFALLPFYSGIATPADEAMVVGDMDRDGKADVVSVHTDLVDSITYPRLTIAYGNGFGSASRQTSVPVTSAANRKLAAAEVNGDGWLDVVDANSWRLDVMLNDTQGSLLPAQVMVHEATDGLSADDINGDFRPDVLAGVRYASDMMVLVQGPQGLIVPPTRLRSYPLAGDTVVADMDGDRRKDVVMAHGSGAISLFVQTDNGLQEGIKYRLPLNDVAASSGPLAVGDVNGDGCRDVVLSILRVGLVTLEGQHCWIAVNGSQPLIPAGSNALSNASVREALPPAQMAVPDASEGVSRLGRVRNWMVRANPLPRVLSWVRARYVAMFQESATPEMITLRNRPMAKQQSIPISRTVTHNAPRSHSILVLYGSDKVCLR